MLKGCGSQPGTSEPLIPHSLSWDSQETALSELLLSDKHLIQRKSLPNKSFMSTGYSYGLQAGEGESFKARYSALSDFCQ